MKTTPTKLTIAIGGFTVAMITGCASLEERLASPDRQTRFEAEAELIANAQKQGTDEDRIVAVNRVSTNFEVLRDLVSNPRTKESVALAAVAKLEKDEDLSVVATRAGRERIKIAALRQIKNEEVLFKHASETSNTNVFAAAVEKITDQAKLGQLAKKASTPEMRKTVCVRITDPKILCDSAKSVADDQVKIDAIRRLDEVGAIKEVALSSQNGKVRMAAVEKLSDTGALVDIAVAKISRTEEKTVELSPEEIAKANAEWEQERRMLPKHLRKHAKKDIATTKVVKTKHESPDGEVVAVVVAKASDDASLIRLIKTLGQELTAEQLSLIKSKNQSVAIAAAISEVELAKAMADIDNAIKAGKSIAPYFGKIFETKNEQLALELCKKFPEQVPAIRDFVAHDMASCVECLLQNGRTADGGVCLLLAALSSIEDEDTRKSIRDKLNKSPKESEAVKKIISANKGTVLKVLAPNVEKRAQEEDNWDYKKAFSIRESGVNRLRAKYDPLHVVAQNGKLWFVEKYMDDIDLDARFTDGTPIEIALQNGRLELASFLLKNGAKAPDVSAMLKRTFSNDGEKKIADWLIENKVATEIAIYAFAVKNGNLDLAKAMQHKNAKLKPAGRFTDYFIGKGLFEDSDKALRLAEYLKANALAIDVPSDKYSALGTVLWESNKRSISDEARRTLVALAKWLVENGADVNYDIGLLKQDVAQSVKSEIQKEARDHALFPATIELCAQKWGMSQADINTLIQELKDISDDENFQVETAWMEGAAGEFSFNRNENIREKYAYKIILRAWEKLGKVKYVKEDTIPALYLAVQNNMTELVELMLAKGAVVPCVMTRGNGKQWNAIEQAEENKNKKLVRMLRMAEQGGQK